MVKIIIELIIGLVLILGFVFEDKIAKWERRNLQKILRNKKIGHKLEQNGIYPYDVKKERLF